MNNKFDDFTTEDDELDAEDAQALDSYSSDSSPPLNPGVPTDDLRLPLSSNDDEDWLYDND